MAERPQPRQAAHPTPLTYLKVAFSLVVLTGIEVGVFYIEPLEAAFLPIFLILSVVKFVLVVLFYMHLKFDSRLFSMFFVGGLVLAVLVAVTLLALFQVLSAVANPSEGPETTVGLPVVPTATPTVAPTTQPTGEPTTQPTGEATAEPADEPTEAPTVGPTGQEIFMNVPDNAAPQALWCSLCHTIEGVAPGLIGPDLTHIGTDAATSKPGMSAEEYIRESITEPEVFICARDRCTPGLMTKAITGALTDEQVEALVAFLLDQK